LRDWFANRSGREQAVLALGTLALAAALAYVLVLEPLHQRLAAERRRVQVEASLLEFVRGAAAEAAALRRTGAQRRGPGSDRPLLSVVNDSAAAVGLDGAIRRATPDGRGALRLSFDSVAFDPLVAWLAGLERAHGVQVSGISLERLPEDGRVRVNLVLGAGAALP